MKCFFCNSNIPQDRLARTRSWKTVKNARRYCSTICIKRQWHVYNRKAKIHTILEGENLSSCTGKGLYWEIHAQKVIGGELQNTKIMNKSVDLILENGKTVDVKSSNFNNRSGSWVFKRSYKNTADLFFCICLEENIPVKYYLIPRDKYPMGGASIGRGLLRDKYEQFKLTPLK